MSAASSSTAALPPIAASSSCSSSSSGTVSVAALAPPEKTTLTPDQIASCCAILQRNADVLKPRRDKLKSMRKSEHFNNLPSKPLLNTSLPATPKELVNMFEKLIKIQSDVITKCQAYEKALKTSADLKLENIPGETIINRRKRESETRKTIINEGREAFESSFKEFQSQFKEAEGVLKKHYDKSRAILNHKYRDIIDHHFLLLEGDICAYTEGSTFLSKPWNLNTSITADDADECSRILLHSVRVLHLTPSLEKSSASSETKPPDDTNFIAAYLRFGASHPTIQEIHSEFANFRIQRHTRKIQRLHDEEGLEFYEQLEKDLKFDMLKNQDESLAGALARVEFNQYFFDYSSICKKIDTIFQDHRIDKIIFKSGFLTQTDALKRLLREEFPLFKKRALEKIEELKRNAKVTAESWKKHIEDTQLALEKGAAFLRENRSPDLEEEAEKEANAFQAAYYAKHFTKPNLGVTAALVQQSAASSSSSVSAVAKSDASSMPPPLPVSPSRKRKVTASPEAAEQSQKKEKEQKTSASSLPASSSTAAAKK